MEFPFSGKLHDLRQSFVIEGDGKILFRTVENDLTRIQMLQSRNGLKQLSLTASRNTRYTEYLACTRGKGNIVYHLDAVGICTVYM